MDITDCKETDVLIWKCPRCGRNCRDYWHSDPEWRYSCVCGFITVDISGLTHTIHDRVMPFSENNGMYAGEQRSRDEMLSNAKLWIENHGCSSLVVPKAEKPILVTPEWVKANSVARFNGLVAAVENADSLDIAKLLLRLAHLVDVIEIEN